MTTATKPTASKPAPRTVAPRKVAPAAASAAPVVDPAAPAVEIVAEGSSAVVSGADPGVGLAVISAVEPVEDVPVVVPAVAPEATPAATADVSEGGALDQPASDGPDFVELPPDFACPWCHHPFWSSTTVCDGLWDAVTKELVNHPPRQVVVRSSVIA